MACYHSKYPRKCKLKLCTKVTVVSAGVHHSTHTYVRTYTTTCCDLKSFVIYHLQLPFAIWTTIQKSTVHNCVHAQTVENISSLASSCAGRSLCGYRWCRCARTWFIAVKLRKHWHYWINMLLRKWMAPLTLALCEGLVQLQIWSLTCLLTSS